MITQMPEYVRSEYEMEWERDINKFIDYRGVRIFNYDDGNSWTFWYGPDGSDYVSSLHTLEEALYWVDKEIERLTKST